MTAASPLAECDYPTCRVKGVHLPVMPASGAATLAEPSHRPE